VLQDALEHENDPGQTGRLPGCVKDPFTEELQPDPGVHGIHNVSGWGWAFAEHALQSFQVGRLDLLAAGEMHQKRFDGASEEAVEQGVRFAGDTVLLRA